MGRLDTLAYAAAQTEAAHRYRIATGGQKTAAYRAYVRSTAAKLVCELAGIPQPRKHRKRDYFMAPVAAPPHRRDTI